MIEVKTNDKSTRTFIVKIFEGKCKMSYTKTLAFILLAYIFVFFVNTFFHEMTHYNICGYYGGNATIHWGFTSYTVCSISNSELLKLNSLNEIVNYNLQSIILALFLILAILISYLEFGGKE